jgi:hypothetical protein
MKRTVKDLKDEGFDKSYYSSTRRSSTVACSQCLAVVINGTPTHERGCPNIKKENRNDSN